MDKLIYNIVLVGIPEVISLTLFCTAIANISLNWRIYIQITIIINLVVYLARLLQIHFGLHTIVATIILGFLVHRASKISFSKGLIYSSLSFLALIIIETIYYKIIGNIDMNNIVNESSLILLKTPVAFILMLLSFVVNIIQKHKYGKCK